MAVATAAVIGIGTGIYSAYSSFDAAAKEKQAADKANADAKKLMSDAKRKAEKDFYGGLAVPLDAYDQEFENLLAGQQQSVEALQEGDARALAAGVGRVGALQQEAAEEQRIAMGEDLFNLETLKAESQDAINQQLIEMDASAAREQNIRSSESEQRRANAISQGVTAVGGALQSAASVAPLFSKNQATRRGAKLGEQLTEQGVGKGKFKTKADFQSALADKYESGDITKEQYKRWMGEAKDKSTFNYESIFGINFDPYAGAVKKVD
jgi:hypothetical protein